MAFFTSDRERRLWLWSSAVLVAIYATLGPAQRLAQLLREQNLLRAGFVVLLLAGLALVLRHWIRRPPGRREMGVAIGVAAVYAMVLVRIGTVEERTHLFEYGLVSILVYQALTERRRRGRAVPVPAILAVSIAALLGWIDEGIQYALPNRVYDVRDVIFNCIAAVMAVASTLLMGWSRRE